MSVHRDLPEGEMHFLQQWSVADNTARDALSVASDDVGKVCEVGAAGATKTFYILADDSPMAWTEMGGGGGAGDVVGPASATDNAIVRFDGTTGELIQDSGITIADGASGTLAGTNSGDVTLNASVADILGLTGQELTADDPAADRIVFWDDSAGKLVYLTAGTGLTITDTTLSASGGGVTLDTAVTLTTQTSVDFTIPAGTKKIAVLLSGVSSNGSSDVIVRLGDSGGIETTGYTSEAAQIAVSTPATGGAVTNGFTLVAGSTRARTGAMYLDLLDSSSNTWVVTCVYVSTSDTVVYMAGSKALSAELTTLRLTTGNGTDQLDAGIVNVNYQS